MPGFIESDLEAMLVAPFCFGQVSIQKTSSGFELCHRDDEAYDQLEIFRNARDAIEIARYDDDGNYRPLKTAPNLRHGWCMEIGTMEELKRALDNFYPGRLEVFVAWQGDQLHTTPLRETLDRQSGMYRVAAKISDTQIDDLVADFCRSNDGCLRTILWKRDQSGAIASTKLPKEKFDPTWDQVQATGRPGTSAFSKAMLEKESPPTIPLLCQEACNLLVSACRNVVKAE
jgi:sirohydrochlorin cobaltochelatase